MTEAEKYVREVFKDVPDYRHYSSEVKSLLREISRLRNKLRKQTK